MLHACVRKFDVTDTAQTFLATKHPLVDLTQEILRIYLLDLVIFGPVQMKPPQHRPVVRN